jgi:putative membrane protein
MTTDAWLAVIHHVAVFSLAAALAAQWGLERPGLSAADVRRLARIDAAYGTLIGVVIAAGVSRVIWGVKPADFYLDSATFWLKMVSLAVVAVLSIRPRLRHAAWRRAVDADPSALPPDHVVTAAHRIINVQLAVFVLIPIFAALMARGIGN